MRLEDGTIPQWLSCPVAQPFVTLGCAQVHPAQKLSLVINFDVNQRVNLQMMRLLTSFSTVCVKNPVFTDGAGAGMHGLPHGEHGGTLNGQQGASSPPWISPQCPKIER